MKTEEKSSTIKIGVIGYGYWGPNVVRNFNAVPGAKVAQICDKRPVNVHSVCTSCKETIITTNTEDVIKSPDIDVVAIVTPVSTHYELAKAALENGKHVFVEKPFTTSREHAEELIELAEKKKLKIAVDHTFLFTGAVRKIKETIYSGELGNIYYYDSTRINLGLFQHDVNVVWDLAPHDFAIMRHIIDQKPEAIRAFGKSHVNAQEDIAYIFVYFSDNLVAHFHVNWLSPVKIRETMIGGEKKMLVWDDVASDEKIKLYDRGVNITNNDGNYNLRVSYRSGDMLSPKVDTREALALECESFIDNIRNDTAPLSDGHMGLEVVKLLVACERSVKNNGGLVLL